MKRTGLLALAGTLAAGCGDPMAAGDYLGEPLYRVHGRIVGDAGTSAIRRPYLGVLWIDPYDSSGLGMVTMLTPIQNPRFPGEFSIDFFDRPPARVYLDMAGARLALGMAIVLDDVDGDGEIAFDPEIGVKPPDVMFGAARQLVVDVQAVGTRECQTWTFGGSAPVAPGFHLADLPTCSATSGVDVLPDGTALEVRLFPPGQIPPDLTEEDETECPEPPSCEEDPTQVSCAMEEASQRCFETACGDAQRAWERCFEVDCADAADSSACYEQICDPLGMAVMECTMTRCTLDAICSY